jgi:diguanylate cyclase (GGDEF)-like protein
MMRTAEKRTRPWDYFLLVVLLANLVCGVGLIGALRAELSKDLVAAESTLASSKISAYLWGKVLRFTSAVAEGRRVGENATSKGGVDALTSASDLPVNESFQRIRSGTGESLPVFIGVPRNLPGRGRVLPLAILVAGVTNQDPHYVIGAISLAAVDGYIGDLRRRGILCRIVDPEGNTLFGASGEFQDRRDSASRVEGGAAVMGGALSREWSLQTYIPNAGSRLPFLPQAILATFFLLNMATLVYLRQRFILPAEAALEAVSETVVAQGEILPPRADPGHIAGAVNNLLSRRRLEWEEENRSVRETTERSLREISESQKNLLSHHRLTKKMLQSRQADEVFQILLAGVTDGYGYSGALLGKVSADGYLDFQGETDPASGSPLRIPLWNPGSLLARTFWSGNLFHASPRELAHLPEEESILGSFPVLCLPVMRNLKERCVEVKNSADRSSPSYHSENLKCWFRQVPQEFLTGGGDPEVHRKAITACLRCEVFPSSALLVVRSVENGKVLNRENAVPISSLALEAGHALEVVSLYDNMKIMAVTDGLTGLYNHREFYQSLRRELERARRYRHTVSLLMIDVDDFKRFNDQHGHPAGDFALRNIANLLRKCARTSDIIARYGGEEFAVILPESTPGGALMVAERIKLEIAGHKFIQNAKDPEYLTVSIGIYSSENGDVTEDQIVSLADDASYTAKTAGKNQVVVKTTS